jgi:hypothetical protein
MSRSPYRIHERTSFFKYMPASTARQVLKNRTLRWSSPVLFNDPFDVPRELAYEVAPSEIAEAIENMFIALLENPPDDTASLEPSIGFIVDLVKKEKSAEFTAEMIGGIRAPDDAPKPTGAGLEEMRVLWRSWIPDSRILCLSESPDHMAMWYHYADKYKGVVMEFACSDELDSASLAAKQVEYLSDLPDLFNAVGWARLIMMPRDEAVRKLLDLATYTKSPDWSYEREWRVASSKRPNDTGPYTDWGFDERELSTVYCGPMVAPDDRAAIIELSGKYPNARIFDVAIGMSREFIFTEVRLKDRTFVLI